MTDETQDPLSSFDTTIKSDDKRQLRTYFRLGGLGKFQRSPMGGMLDNAKLFSPIYEPCNYCGGVKGTDTTNDVSGRGFIEPSSWKTEKKKKYLAIAAQKSEAKDLQPGDDCAVCGGRGWRVETKWRAKKTLTAKPRADAGINHGATHDLDIDVDLGVCIRVEKILDRADVLFPIATATLASLHSKHGVGDVSVWHLTPAGKLLLKEYTGDSVAFFSEMLLEGSKDEKTTELLLQATQQGIELVARASQAWNAAAFVYKCGI